MHRSSTLKSIQKALEEIRIETAVADWQLRLRILQLILSNSESVVAGAYEQAAWLNRVNTIKAEKPKIEFAD